MTTSEGMIRYWASLSIEEKQARAEKQRQSIRRYYETLDSNIQRGRNGERSRSLSLTLAGMSAEERRSWCEISFHNSEGKEASCQNSAFRLGEVQERATEGKRRFHAGMTLEERRVWTERSFHNSESVRKRNGHWASESPEDKEKRLRSSFLSDESILKARKTSSRGPSVPEIYLGMKLEEYFPGVWAYNGGAEQGIVIERKVPDFISRNGFKAIIEVFGDFYHNPDYRPLRLSEGELIELYERYGYKCLVVWEDDCFGLEIVGRIRAWLDETAVSDTVEVM